MAQAGLPVWELFPASGNQSSRAGTQTGDEWGRQVLAHVAINMLELRGPLNDAC